MDKSYAWFEKMYQIVTPFCLAAIAVLLIFMLSTLNTKARADASRKILCTGIIANVSNTARDDPSVVQLCKEVGVDRTRFPDTLTTP